jgi:hypothetical protein
LSVSEKARMAQFEAEDDLRTLSRAEEIRGDRKRMVGAQRVLNKQERGLRRIKRTLGKGRRPGGSR